ncbi:RNA polymerase sigma factor [Telluria beijingensis]|uniref:RNA polymerase sigma factor n=1 Tax=Telluria beijingensis TaxID=3068633 RepID=UPI00279597A3|nr:sigma-70 family RNA polymerase sigma factor [Massilia sp. REN29]
MNHTHDRHGHLADLIAGAAAGDRAAFRELHALTHDYLYHTALRLLRLPSLAEEALQEAYLSIWLHAASFRPGQASPMTWLIAIVRNRALSVLRSNRSGIAPLICDEDPALLVDMEEEEDVDPGARVFDALARLRLAHAMTRLEPAQRQSIALAYGQELTHAEIASHLGVPLGTAKSWLRRGLERLRIGMDEPARRQPVRPASTLADCRP